MYAGSHAGCRAGCRAGCMLCLASTTPAGSAIAPGVSEIDKKSSVDEEENGTQNTVTGGGLGGHAADFG